MNYTKTKRVIRLLVLLTILGLALQHNSVALADNTNGPELPAQCSSIQVPAGNQLVFHVYARGVQIYKWTNGNWQFDSPLASLFAEPGYFGEVGSHYVGPKWESKSGSKVKGARVPGTGCSPDLSAVAWLLLEKVESTGPGVFSLVTYIQRVNTTGGIAPTTPGSIEGEVREVPYTAEYYFYRAQD